MAFPAKFLIFFILIVSIHIVCCDEVNECDEMNKVQDEEIAKEFKHMAMLGYDIGSRIVYGCHGVLIDASFVLTTAACTNMEYIGQPIVIRLGVSCPHFQYHNVSNIVVHPEYDPSLVSNDTRSVALIKMVTSAENTEYVTPTKLHKTKISDKQQPIEAAWVKSTNDITVVVKFHLTVLPFPQCFENYQNRSPAIIIRKKSEVCAYPIEESKDSVGIIHLMKNGKLQPVGIMAGSAGVPPTETFPHIYLRISHYLGWIRENMKSQSTAT